MEICEDFLRFLLYIIGNFVFLRRVQENNKFKKDFYGKFNFKRWRCKPPREDYEFSGYSENYRQVA